ncbi:response regulator [Spirosoma agri]|uniref:Response regulator n=1 Tax=Spirosoma agri TaxID=1987381 RepID=A0A6M0IG76_9BACT|nr:response regulator [Spirosoma agri]NEU66361.1 response regulator [Spirosoma agri]
MSVNRYNTSASSQHARHASLLIVEDNDDQWQLIQIALKQSFSTVKAVRVASAEEATSYLDNCFLQGRGLPKLILLDLYLPEREDGWGLLKALKQSSSACKQLPVVVLSHSSDREDISESYFYGSTSYITKPSDVDEWKRYIDTLRIYWWETVTLPNDRIIF